MTYRKLFLIILTVSTLGLVVVWWLASACSSELIMAPKPGSFRVDVFLENSSIGLQVYPRTLLSGLHFDSKPGIDPSDDAFERFGVFDFGSVENPVSPYGHTVYSVFFLAVPVWFPYLVIVGSAYLFTRIMEERSRKRQEKPLAVKHAADESESPCP